MNGLYFVDVEDVDPTPNRAIVYVRTSTKKQRIDPQVTDCMNYVRGNNYECVTVVEDEGRSAYRNQNQGLHDVVEQIERGDLNVNRVVIRSYDRLSRNITTGIDLIDRLTRCGVRIEAIHNNIDYSTPEGMRRLRYCLVDSQYESEQKSYQMRRSIARRRRAGQYVGTVAYGKHIQNGELTDNPDEQDIITVIKTLRSSGHNNMTREIISRIADPRIGRHILENSGRGLDYEEIANYLNQLGILRRGVRWNESSIRYILNGRKRMRSMSAGPTAKRIRRYSE